MANDIKNTLLVLKGARKLLEGNKSWAQGTFALTKKGNKCRSVSPFACSWCAIGAVTRAHEDLPLVVDLFELNPREYLETAMCKERHETVPDANDKPSTKHLHVLMAYDFAILMAQDDLKWQRKQLKESK